MKFNKQLITNNAHFNLIFIKNKIKKKNLIKENFYKEIKNSQKINSLKQLNNFKIE